MYYSIFQRVFHYLSSVLVLFGLLPNVQAAIPSECDPQSEIVTRTDDVTENPNGMLTCRAYNQYRIGTVTVDSTADVMFLAGNSISVNGQLEVMQGAIFSLNVALIPWGLNDTGASKCSSLGELNIDCPVPGYPQQDGQSGRDFHFPNAADGHAGFSFTKLDASGNPLLAGASSWSCVLDNTTGLVWEKKTTEEGLQDIDNTYTWYNPDPTENGGHAGTQNGGICSGSIGCDTEAYATEISRIRLCGKDNWQVPSISQLVSIVRNGDLGGNVRGENFKPAFEKTFFPNTNYKKEWPDQSGLGHWTATRTSAGVAYAHYVNFGIGTNTTDGMNNPHFLRLVHSDSIAGGQ